MDVKLGQFTTEDNLRLYYNVWQAKEEAPCVVYLHGLESHMGWFFNIAEFLKSRGMNVYAFDRRGSGLNRGNCKSFCEKHILSDLEAFLDLVRYDHPESKIFLLGLCLGGKVAVSFATSYKYHLDGLILISPSLKNNLKFPFLDMLSILFRPNSMIKSPIKDSMFTSNEKYLKYIKKDAMRLRYIPAQHFLEIARMDKLVKKALRNVRLPVLMMLAGKDGIIDIEGTKKWFEKLLSKDKTMKVYDDFHHILTFEENAGLVLGDIAGWIQDRCDDKDSTNRDL